MTLRETIEYQMDFIADFYANAAGTVREIGEILLLVLLAWLSPLWIGPYLYFRSRHGG